MAIVDRITSQMAEEIAAGTYRSGHPLPTRKELMARFQAARGTIDRAIEQLRQRGLIASRQGSGTYVAAAPSHTTSRRVDLYLAQNTQDLCLESGPYDQRWSRLLSTLPQHAHSHFASAEEMLGRVDDICSGPAPRVIWNRPSLASYHAIQQMDRLGVPQILINRPHPSFNYVATDTRASLLEVLLTVRQLHPDPRIGVLAPCLNPALPFLAERELYFHDLVTELGLRRVLTPRASATNNQALIAATKAALEAKPHYLFIPDSSLLPYALSLASHAEAPVNLIAFAGREHAHAADRLIRIDQNWDEMFVRALEWALAEPPAPFQQGIKATITFPDAL